MSASPHLTRRRLLAAALLTPASVAWGPTAWAEPSGAYQPETAETETGGRKIDLYIWRAPNPHAVTVFFHGAGADPMAYHRLLERWQAAGISVVAPLHVDSQLHPDHEKYDLRRAFSPRLADTAASVAYARAAFPGVKAGAAGHSYGSLFAEIAAGAASNFFGPPKSPVDAVVTFSSPGKIQPFVGPDSFKTFTAPFLALTGDADVVPGATEDWHDHLYAYETAPPGDKYAWIGKGVDHLYGGAIDRAADPHAMTAAFDEAAALSTQFLRAYLEDDGAARAHLASRADTALGHLQRR